MELGENYRTLTAEGEKSEGDDEGGAHHGATAKIPQARIDYQRTSKLSSVGKLGRMRKNLSNPHKSLRAERRSTDDDEVAPPEKGMI